MRLPAGNPPPESEGRRPWSTSRTAWHGRRRAAITSTLALVTALLAAGCHVPGSGGTGAAKLSPLTVAASPGTADAPLFLALRDGLFAKAGLRVTVAPQASASRELADLRRGSVGVVATDYADGLYAQSAQGGLLIVADGYDAAPNVMEVLVLPSSRITTPAQLAGKTIGTPAPDELPYTSGVPYSLATLATQSVLLDDGVQPTAVTWKPLPEDQLVRALGNHQVDAILATEPVIFQAESSLGATEVLDSLSGQTADIPLSGYFTSRAYARAHANSLMVFRSVLFRAQAQAASGSAVRAVLSRGMKAVTADMVTLGVYPTSLNVGGIQQVADLMYNFGMVPQELDIGAMVFR